jgi:hypothetical protein
LKGLRSNIDVLETRLGFNRLVIVDNNWVKLLLLFSIDFL